MTLNVAVRVKRGRPRRAGQNWWVKICDRATSAPVTLWTAECGSGPCSVRTHRSGQQTLNINH